MNVYLIHYGKTDDNKPKNPISFRMKEDDAVSIAMMLNKTHMHLEFLQFLTCRSDAETATGASEIMQEAVTASAQSDFRASLDEQGGVPEDSQFYVSEVNIPENEVEKFKSELKRLSAKDASK